MSRHFDWQRQTIARRVILTGIAAAGLAALTTGFAASQDRYPSRAIRIVVPFPDGATTDMLARLFA